MKLTAILRIKDQIDIIDDCLKKLSEIVDEIIIVDNGSTDGTLLRFAAYPKIRKIMHTVGYDEGRDKIMLLEQAKASGADWILWCDADEVFENHFTRKEAEKYMHSKYNRITFRMCNFWLSKTRYRFDRGYYLYTLHPQRSMWRNLPEAYFKNQKLHNGDIRGVPGRTFISPYRIKHFGYIDFHKMEEKLKRYLAEDKSGDRDYARNINPNIPHLTFKFIEFRSKILNYIYILCYKYLCNILWLLERVRRKLLLVIKRS